uniref:Uncharacterized protein n=1 Tax=Romanomermis culicivorax TaxID=13658 RepID=A0A915I813_ROMCU
MFDDDRTSVSSRHHDHALGDLKRQMDGLKEQYESSRQELESAKQMREWALVERQRIVAERDSIRAMCDELRRDRDNAVTKLADAFRDTEELQRYKEQAERELKRMRDRLDLDSKSKNSATDSPTSPSHSRDSAIDSDMAEWEIETLTIDVIGSQKNDNLGVELRGGRDDPIFGQIVPIYVKSIEKNSKFDGILRVYDCIMQVNNIDVANMERRSVMDILKNSNSGAMINDTPVEGKTAQEVDRIIRNHRGSNLVLTVVKSPPILSPMTPSASFISSSYSTPNNNGAPITTNGLKNTTTTTPTSATSTLSNVYKSGQRFQHPTSKDEGIQVVMDKSVAHQTTKKESLLDKVHDKLFGKNERKSTVRACASIPNDFDDKKINACYSSPHSPATISTATASSSGIFGTRLRLRNAAGGSERVASSSSRYTKTPSICSATFSTSPQQQRALSEDAGDAQQALQQLDSVLEASERENVNRRVSKLSSAVSSPYSGGTWPKLRPISHPTPEPLGPSFMDEVTPLPVITPIRRAKERKHLLPFLFNGPNSGSNGNAQSPLLTLRSRHEMDRKSAQSKSHPHDPCSDRNFVPKSRSQENRPMSYHPSMTNQYYNFGHSSSQQKQNQESGDEMATTSDSLNLYHHQNNSQNSYKLTSQNRPTNFSSSRPTGGARSEYTNSGIGELPRDSSSSGGVAGRRPRVLSQYDPVYANLSENNFSSISRRHNQPFFVKNSQHGPPRYKPPPPACAFSSSTPCSSSSFGQQSINAMTANMTNSSSVEQDMDAQSITSQSSGFSRCGLKNNFFYNSQASKSSVQAKIDANRYQSDEYSSSYQSKLSQGDVRTITLEKRNSHEFLGITVARANSGNGIFVSSVCGINMRSADTYYANNVLRNIPQQDIDVSLVVQYNPERYFGNVQSSTSYSTTTPRATPSSFGDKSREYTLKSQASQRSHDIMSVADSANSLRHAHHQPRIAYVKKENSDWGFTLIGGNAIGIFVDELKSDSPAYGPDGLMNGDQILEFDDLNFRKLTLEQALFELNQRPCDSLATLRVQFNEAKYQKCKTGAGDSFYIQVNVERKAENNDELSYKVGDVLRVDNTVFNGVTGLWRAWLIDQEGREISCGIIPSKSKLEEAYAKMSASEISGCLDGNSENGGSRRGTIRRSWKFMRRSSRTNPSSSNAPPPPIASSTAASTINHQRTSSKDSRDLIADPSSSLLMHDEPYQRVEHKRKRPVLILGPLSEIFIAKLLEDYPKVYSQCVPECVQPDLIRKLDHGVEHAYVDCRKRDKLYEVTSFSALKEIMEKGFHCILHVNVSAVERLRRLHIYPVVVFVKFKNAKQIKEISEDKINSKLAKEMFETASRLEIEFFQLFSTVIQGPHNNVKYICQQIASAVEHEQKKTLWVASNEAL